MFRSLLRGMAGLAEYVRYLERAAHVSKIERRELLARRPDTLQLLGELSESETASRVAASLAPETGRTGSTEQEVSVSLDDEMSTSEAADLIGIGQRGVHDAYTRGRIKGRKVGGRVRLSRWSVEAYARRNA
jgi:excisionase family DNA binding protein